MLNISKQKVHDRVHEEFDLYSLNTLHTPRSAVVLKRWLIGIGVVLLLIIFLPWQQNINGKGEITALTPKDRPQNIQNIIAGRIEKWLVKEGDYVEKGDTILVVSEIKDDYFDKNLSGIFKSNDI